MNINEFKSPGVEYRGAPFWSWNDDLKEDELRRQVRLMKDAGLGGFFMHSREGLITPYMATDKKKISEEWLKCIRITVDEAKKTDMLAYLYDEDRWPSGFAGGIVSSKGEKYRIKILECIGDVNDPKFRVKTDNKVKWYNNYSYIDTLNKEVVNEFIKSTHDVYYKEAGREFGKVIPAIFTDEANYMHYRRGDAKYFVPWTNKLPFYFKNKNGYDIRDNLVSLFYEKGEYKKIRYDFWRTVTQLFLESYTKTIYDWCSKHKIAYTGHYWEENTLEHQILFSGKVMAHYEYMHIPGVDNLFRYAENVITIKQVSSVAHQLGKKRVLSETYGASGWNLTFEDQKWIGDWEYTLGINLLNQHLALYSMKGSRKRDYPPSLYYQQPWWKHHRIIADYFARLSYILTQGKFVADVLVIHPMESAWCVYSPVDKAKVEKLNKVFDSLSKILCGLHRDYDYGDEDIMERYASVNSGKLNVGKMKYKVVVIPPLFTLRKSTVKVLKKFLASGGRIIAIRPLPYLVDGVHSEAINNLFNNKNVHIIDKCMFDNEKERFMLEHTLDLVLEKDVKICDPDSKEINTIYYQHRIDGSKHIYFLSNISQVQQYKNVRVHLNTKGRVNELNLFNGNVSEIPSKMEDGYTVITLEFAPVSSHLITVDTLMRPVITGRFLGSEKRNSNEIKLSNVWNVEQSDYNALTIDFCRYRIGNNKFSDKMFVLNVQEELKKSAENKGFTIRYNFYSKLKTLKNKSIYLILEQPEIYNIRINGMEVKYKDIGWWVDISFKKIDISGLIKFGENTIEITSVFKDPIKKDTLIYKRGGVEVESCYVIGNFTVGYDGNVGYYLDEEKVKVQNADLVKQGYPFFAGSIVLSQNVNIKNKGRYKNIINLNGLEAVSARVIVNGMDAGLIICKPYSLDVTKFVKNGINKIEIELTNSLRNLLGPHHQVEGELLLVCPQNFLGDAGWWGFADGFTNDYSFVRFGIF